MLVLMAIEDMLTDLGCTSIQVAGTLAKALDLVKSHSFDLAMLDVNLNGQRSYPVAEELTAQCVPFAFSTGYGEHGVDQGFGHCAVLTQPYNESQLRVVLAELLAPDSDDSRALTS